MSGMRRRAWCAVLVSLGAAAACGDGQDTSSGEPIDSSPSTSIEAPAEPPSTSTDGDAAAAVIVPVAARTTPATGPEVAGDAITAFGLELFGQVRSADPAANATVSPASVAIALAMVEPGTVDAAQEQMSTLLRIDDPAAFHDSMNALEQDLEDRTPGDFGGDGDPGEVTINIANAAFLQQGYPFEADYLDAVGTNYGPVLREVDFMADPNRVAHEINDFVADATDDQIVDLIADGTIKPETVLALVNALYLKASWLETFDETATTDHSFTTLDGSTVDIALMRGASSSSAAGDGWVAATKSYVGGFSAQFFLPDEGRFDEIAADLATVLADYETNRTSGAELAVPRFETRTSTELSPALKALGLTGPYTNGGLLGVADDPRLVIDQVIHEAFVAMDEDGTEAAAATVVLGVPTEGPALQPVPVVLDRPFLYRIVDDTSGATLFIGQITDPTA
jgi:Serine protease inhibitor